MAIGADRGVGPVIPGAAETSVSGPESHDTAGGTALVFGRLMFWLDRLDRAIQVLGRLDLLPLITDFDLLASDSCVQMTGMHDRYTRPLDLMVGTAGPVGVVRAVGIRHEEFNSRREAEHPR